MANVLFIDNFDSFTYNLVEEFRLLNHQVTVVRNSVELEQLIALALNADLIVLSPGPGGPLEAGNCLMLLEEVRGKKPVLGICLGHQLIASAYGMKVVRAPVPVHGKAALLNHVQSDCFASLTNPMVVGRYHSLMIDEVADGFDVLANVDDIIMAIFNRQDKMLGFQFHPESVLSTQGSELLERGVQLLLEGESSLSSEKLSESKLAQKNNIGSEL
ncbi:aminodeoxychorismate/anthranilate synthase component II [Pleionea litopenaei]|uniref:anthranilate synthase n=1 Tax=Pleionea litopenaei TaxID=3070815 RepID=A0AA51X701_9GAMM|nr:aminodeoxychorismate/anthranilate synthase component II [Pleionea sp. HL-JVS1]WMS87399.1 aminodeoxychorismate/anthranilate synthase component II [Pleionea sp. HL-JVS1]